MSKEAFDSKEAIYAQIPNSEIKYPDIPVDIAVQEAEDLYVWCQADKEKLVKAALDWQLVKDLPVRTGSCRYIQSQWQKEYNLKKDAKQLWEERSAPAYELRNELLHHLTFAYEKIPDLLAQVRKIAEGSGHADMIQDLSDLAALGKANPAPLQKIQLDMAIFDKAETDSGELAVLLANYNGSKMEDNHVRVLRDKAYSHMKEAMDEIRRTGQYVFWKDDSRRKGYISKYNKSKRRSKPKNGETLEETKD